MIVRPISDVQGLERIECSNCLNEVNDGVLIEVPGLSLVLCRPCGSELRGLLPPRKARRPLSPKARRVLAWMAQTPVERGSLATIGAAVGGYAYNTITTLVERGLLEQIGGEPGRSFLHATFKITPLGLAEVTP
jgi:chromosome segregation and condensation protein ScpB